MRPITLTNLARKVLLLFPVLALILLSMSCNGAGDAVDLTVTNVEVTQAIQTPTNTVQLAAQRRTAVRATLGVTGGASPAGVTGRLHVFVGGAEITDPAGLAPLASITAPAAPDRANETHTLNFELPTPSGIGASTDVDFRVDVTPVPGETDTGNNSGSANNLTFVARTNPIIFFTRINYAPSGLGNPPDAFIQAGTGDAFIRGIFPVNEADPTLYRQGLFPSLGFNEDADGNGRLDVFAAEGDNLISLLASCRQLIVDSGVGPADQVFLYGWIAGPVDGNGLSTIPGRNAFGNAEENRGQRTFAHEMGHLFGLVHNGRNLDQVGWDVGGRLPGNPAGNNVTGRVRPTTLFDIMVAGLLTNQAWVDTTTYNFFFSHAVLGGAPDSGDQAKPSERVAVIQGIFDPSGERLVSLKPVFRYPWPSQPISRPRNLPTRYVAEVIDDGGNTIKVPFDALKGEDSKESRGELRGFFEVMVPVAANREIVSVRITDLEGRREFGSQKRSRPPTVRISAPQSGGQLGERTEVTWEATDPDTSPDQLMFQIAYSADGGRSFVPVAVDVRGNKATFDSTEIQMSDGNGLIRVFVSDGTNTAFAQVDKLTTRAAKYKGYGQR